MKLYDLTAIISSFISAKSAEANTLLRSNTFVLELRRVIRHNIIDGLTTVVFWRRRIIT